MIVVYISIFINNKCAGMNIYTFMIYIYHTINVYTYILIKNDSSEMNENRKM